VECPTEIAIPGRQEVELDFAGLIPLCYVKRTTEAVFPGADSLQKPKEYQGPGGVEATESARLSARLPYVFVISRFAHYIKVIVRDSIVRPMESEEIQFLLQNWI